MTGKVDKGWFETAIDVKKSIDNLAQEWWGADSVAKAVHEVAIAAFVVYAGWTLVCGPILFKEIEATLQVAVCAVTAVFLLLMYEAAWTKKEVVQEEEELTAVHTEAVVKGQPPGLNNNGNTCFINTGLQGLLACSSFRQPLLEVAQKEERYCEAWDKFCRAVLVSEGEEWTEEEMKGVLICLARMGGAEKVCSVEEPTLWSSLYGLLRSWVKEASQEEPAEFLKLLKAFIEAEIKDENWPSVEGKLEVLRVQIQHSRKNPSFVKDHRSDYWQQKTAFSVLYQVISNYMEREAALEGGEEQPNLTALRGLMPGGIQGNSQEDVGEFISEVLRKIRPCEYPGLFPVLENRKEMVKFEGEMEGKQSEETLPEKGIIRTSQLLRAHSIDIPNAKCMVQDLLNEWLSKTLSQFASEKDKINNLMFYKEGNFYIRSEQNVVTDFPEHMVIGLKRFDIDGDKITTDAYFAEEVLIQDQAYRLVAIAEHSGGKSSGHYTALVRRDEKWWHCNDRSVSQASVLEYARGASLGYFYFLEKVKKDGEVAVQCLGTSSTQTESPTGSETE